MNIKPQSENKMPSEPDDIVLEDGPITYEELGELIAQMTEDQKRCDLSIYDSSIDEFMPVTKLGVVAETDVLDEGSPYLEI